MTNPEITKHFLRRSSIRKRLAVFTCILLLFVVATYSLTSYIGVRKAALLVGKERLHALTRQLNGLLSQSNGVLTTGTAAIANHASVRNYIVQGRRSADTAVLAQLDKLSKDTSNALIGLYDSAKNMLISSGNAGLSSIDITTEWQRLEKKHDTALAGKLYTWKGGIYYPVIAVVKGQQVKGYLVRWRKVLTNPKSLAQLTDLMGLGALIYIGNNDGSVWTDMIHAVPSPLADSLSVSTGKTVEFEKADGEVLIAAVQQMTNSPWVLLVAFSKQKMTEAASRFLFWDIIIGLILILIGVIAAWLMSRGITKPLHQLTHATTAIAGGDYSTKVPIGTEDEVGQLSRSFNHMIMEVQQMQTELERKVQERTAELQLANNELEAFSYSVSHDLRAPLRAISGYSGILKEDYEDKLDAEALRLIDIIVSNTRTMGQLIDDLIAFSMIGRKKISLQPINMKMLVDSCVSEVLEQNKASNCKIFVSELPSCLGDQNLLKQVWMNLISNAVKYSSKKTNPLVEISCNEDNEFFKYMIRDNGVGFDMQYAGKLFNVFQRLHSQAEFEGTGIGLALVRRIVGKHHGEAWAEGVPGEGATFYFSIPKGFH